MPRMQTALPESTPAAAARAPPLLEVRGLAKEYVLRRGAFRGGRVAVRAVDGVSFSVSARETLGLVGESGCGKTTVARMIPRLIEPSRGDIFFEGRSIVREPESRMRPLRRAMQLVFQESSQALNPRKTIASSVGEGLLDVGPRDRAERRRLVEEALSRTGLDPAVHASRFPHELSGGERQRAGIARALVVRPKLLISDEIVSSLDAPSAAEVLRLLAELQEERGHGAVFISHDLGTVRHVAHRVAVMYLGRIVESGPTAAIYDAPHHPYTIALLESRPADHPSKRRRRQVLGEAPGPDAVPSGCRFHTRCPRALDRCRAEDPPPQEIAPGHVSHCFLSR